MKDQDFRVDDGSVSETYQYVSETYLTRLTAFASYNPTYPILILGFQICHNLDQKCPCGYSKRFVFDARS